MTRQCCSEVGTPPGALPEVQDFYNIRTLPNAVVDEDRSMYQLAVSRSFGNRCADIGEATQQFQKVEESVSKSFGCRWEIFQEYSTMSSRSANAVSVMRTWKSTLELASALLRGQWFGPDRLLPHPGRSQPRCLRQPQPCPSRECPISGQPYPQVSSFGRVCK